MACESSCLGKIMCALLVAAIPYLFKATTPEHAVAPRNVMPEIQWEAPRKPAPPPLPRYCRVIDGEDYCCRRTRPRLRWEWIDGPYGPEFELRVVCHRARYRERDSFDF